MTNATRSKSALTPKAAPTLVETRCAEPGCEETTVMPFRRAAKGTHRCPAHSKPATPAEGGAPEVPLGNGTTAVLPNPADAPQPPKTKMRRSSKEPKTPATEVPDWAQRAAGRNTAADMAAVPEVAPVAEPATDAPVTKKGRVPKAAKTPKAKPAATTKAAAPGSLRAIGTAWIESIRAAGHSVSTVSSYSNDLEVAYEFLGGDTAASGITEKQIAAFNVSKGVMKLRSGRPKAQPTILKVRRALRLALVWAEQKGLIKKAPYSAA